MVTTCGEDGKTMPVSMMENKLEWDEGEWQEEPDNVSFKLKVEGREEGSHENLGGNDCRQESIMDKDLQARSIASSGTQKKVEQSG